MTRVKHEFHRMRRARPGERFAQSYERTHVRNHALRIGLIVVGFVLMVAAAVTFWLPGPNFVLVFIGLALIGGQSARVARWMDSGEVTARRWNDEHWDPYPHKRAALGGAWLVGAAAVVGAAWFAHGHGWLPGWSERLVDDALDLVR